MLAVLAAVTPAAQRALLQQLPVQMLWCQSAHLATSNTKQRPSKEQAYISWALALDYRMPVVARIVLACLCSAALPGSLLLEVRCLLVETLEHDRGCKPCALQLVLAHTHARDTDHVVELYQATAMSICSFN